MEDKNREVPTETIYTKSVAEKIPKDVCGTLFDYLDMASIYRFGKSSRLFHYIVASIERSVHLLQPSVSKLPGRLLDRRFRSLTIDNTFDIDLEDSMAIMDKALAIPLDRLLADVRKLQFVVKPLTGVSFECSRVGKNVDKMIRLLEAAPLLTEINWVTLPEDDSKYSENKPLVYRLCNVTLHNMATSILRAALENMDQKATNEIEKKRLEMIVSNGLPIAKMCVGCERTYQFIIYQCSDVRLKRSVRSTKPEKGSLELSLYNTCKAPTSPITHSGCHETLCLGCYTHCRHWHYCENGDRTHQCDGWKSLCSCPGLRSL